MYSFKSISFRDTYTQTYRKMTTLRREGISRDLRGVLAISVIFYLFKNRGKATHLIKS